MGKPAEEGRVWEWRAFGELPAAVAAEVRAHPIRIGVADLQGEDIYVVSPLNDQNVKLRSTKHRWLLKFKLLEASIGGIELYNESNRLTFPFPVEPRQLDEAAKLLDVRLSPSPPSTGELSEDDFIRALGRAAPPAASVTVRKLRSQFEFEGGWFELAEIEFPARRTQSISIHSPELKVVEQTLEHLSLTGLEVMNYVEACRRWSRTGS